MIKFYAGFDGLSSINEYQGAIEYNRVEVFATGEYGDVPVDVLITSPEGYLLTDADYAAIDAMLPDQTAIDADAYYASQEQEFWDNHDNEIAEREEQNWLDDDDMPEPYDARWAKHAHPVDALPVLTDDEVFMISIIHERGEIPALDLYVAYDFVFTEYAAALVELAGRGVIRQASGILYVNQ